MAICGILKTDISDHFAVFSLINTNLDQKNIKNIIIKKDINKHSMKYFKTFLIVLTETCKHKPCENDSTNMFLERFTKSYDQSFPE